MSLQKFPDLRLGVFQVSKDHGLFLAGHHAGGKKTLGQPLFAEIAFLHNPFGPRGKIGVDFLDKRTGVAEIHGPGPIGTSRHTETAPDAAVVVHHDDSIFFSLKVAFVGHTRTQGGLSQWLQRTKGLLFLNLSEIGKMSARERRPKGLVPDPFDFLLGIPKIRNIVTRWQASNAPLQSSSGCTFSGRPPWPTFWPPAFLGFGVNLGRLHAAKASGRGLIPIPMRDIPAIFKKVLRLEFMPAPPSAQHGSPSSWA